MGFCGLRYAYYFIDLMVGTPPQLTSVIVDTGSHLLAFPCGGCDQCGHHLVPRQSCLATEAVTVITSWTGDDGRLLTLLILLRIIKAFECSAER